MKFTPKIIVIVSFLMLETSLMAGWIIKERSYTSEDKTKYKYLYYIQDQKLKIVEDQLISIFDVEHQNLTFVNPEKNQYWSGTLEAFHTESHEALKQMFMDQMKDAKEEEREMIQATFDYYMQSIDDSSSQNQPFLDMVIVNTGVKDKIAGTSASQYGLYVNKKLKEEIWIAEDIPIYQQLDMIRFNAMLVEIGSAIIEDLSYQASLDFAQILKKGLLVKTVEYAPDFTVTTEVYKIKESQIDPAAFNPPAGCQPASLTQLGLLDTD